MTHVTRSSSNTFSTNQSESILCKNALLIHTHRMPTRPWASIPQINRPPETAKEYYYGSIKTTLSALLTHKV